jgi:BRCA1-associated protein
VRIYGVDMVSNPETEVHGHVRGESDGGQGSNGITASAATASIVSRVTKADYKALEGKSSEVGWGIVHLYRDGEETFGLGGGGVDVYNTEGEKSERVESSGLESEKLRGLVCTTLCVPAVPSYLTPSDFLGFMGEKTIMHQVSHVRMVATGNTNRYLVLMKFRDGGFARKWKAEHDGKLFTMLEACSHSHPSNKKLTISQPETCQSVYVKSITFQTPSAMHSNTSFPELSHDPFTPASTASAFLSPIPPPTSNLVELPTCPVCLERMDDTTGLLTIPCQHVFHCACLQKWRGTGCPVCRHTNPSITAQSTTSAYPHDQYSPPFGSGEASLCTVCDSTTDLWICLICGSVGCGRYTKGHAKEHWKDSAHNFALEIETQHVWDYAEETWVHRLIREKGDSKVIELPSSSRAGIGAGRGNHGEVDMVPREKLESIGIEYTHLLTSQLESQRVYFDDQLNKAAAKASAASAAAASASSRAEEAVERLKELEIEHKRLRDEVVPSLEKDLVREKKKSERSGELARGFGKSLMEEKKVSEGLMERIEHVNKSMMEMSTELGKVKEENKELKEENRDLLFSITAGTKLKDMEGEEGGLEKGELEGGTLSLPPEKEKKRGKAKGKGRV